MDLGETGQLRKTYL